MMRNFITILVIIWLLFVTGTQSKIIDAQMHTNLSLRGIMLDQTALINWVETKCK